MISAIIQATNWTLEYITSEISYPALLLILDRWEKPKGKESQPVNKNKEATTTQLEEFGGVKIG